MMNVHEYAFSIAEDLGFDRPAFKGQLVPVRNCWHFYTSGDSVESLFHGVEEFRDGMNRILPVAIDYDVLILAFALMDTHVHFILYGPFDACNHFVHEYLRRTSMYLSSKRTGRKSLKGIAISHQSIDDDRYLKTAICYVVKNPVAAGLPYNSWDYPWSSGALYFRNSDSWTSPGWMLRAYSRVQTSSDLRKLTKSKAKLETEIHAIDGIILPSQYVAVSTVERIFRSHRSYNYFLSTSKDIDVESRGGAISHLSIPLSEMRNNRRTLLQELFGVSELRGLSMEQRVRLARSMKCRYNSSSKQIAKLCGLIYAEVKDLI